MAEKFGFFDAMKSSDGSPDRVYSSEDVNQIYSGILSEGVFYNYANKLNITAGSGLSINIDTGKALVNEHWYINTAIMNIQLNNAHATLARYSSVFLRCNKVTRTVSIIVVDGEPSSGVLIPEALQSDQIYDLRLANIRVDAGATYMTDEAIEDTRTYVSGLVDTPRVNSRCYETTQTREDGGRFFDIPDEYNYTPDTFLLVYVNGILCQSDEYTVGINEVEGNYMIEFVNTIEYENYLKFVMID